MSLRANVLYHLHGKQSVRFFFDATNQSPFLDFPAAEQQFDKILKIDPCRIDDIDVYSNILYVTENRLTLSRLAHDFLALDKDRPEVCCLVGTISFSHLTRIDPNGGMCRQPLLVESRT
jgi:anaphase-promoting complex subunit 8